MEEKDNYCMIYFIANFTCFIILYFISIILVCEICESLLLKIALIVILCYVCAHIELRFLTFFVNFFVSLFLSKKDCNKKQELLKRSNTDNKR